MLQKFSALFIAFVPASSSAIFTGLRKLFFYLTALFVLYVPVASFADSAASQPFYFLALSDIHFDPFTACVGRRSSRPCPLIVELRAAPAAAWPAILAKQDKVQQSFNRDTGFVLLQNSLREAKSAAAKYHPDVVFVLGDTLAHEFRFKYKTFAHDYSQAGYRAFVLKTLEFMNVMLHQAFPDENVLVLTGNNDTYSRNYESEPNGAFFQDAGRAWSSLLQRASDRQQMQSAFAAGGYYALDMPQHPRIRVIALNSVLFSKKARGVNVRLAAQVEIGWLHQQLQLAKDKHQQVLITMHIPPTLNLSLLQSINLFDAHQFFQNDYLQQLRSEFAAFYPQIAGVMTGHLHYDWEQRFSVGHGQHLLMITVPSISPVFGNDPAFKVFHYVPALNRFDIAGTYTYPLNLSPTWQAT